MTVNSPIVHTGFQAFASSSQKNIPIVVPIDIGQAKDNANSGHLGNSVSSEVLSHYFYGTGFNLSSSGKIPSHIVEPIDDQYIVLLNYTYVTSSALTEPVPPETEKSSGSESGTPQRVDRTLNNTRAMALEAVTAGGQVTQVYERLHGYAVRPPTDDTRFIETLRNDPRVALVEPDQRVYALAQTLPTGIDRIDADLSKERSGDGTGAVNVDVAVLDTGIDLTHPDLNVYRSKTFVAGTSSARDDAGHGTLVAGVIGAKDNNAGVVGVAPGARLWAVKVLDRFGNGLISDIIAGIDYVVQNADEIDAANLSFGCECGSTALNSAINTAVSEGITFAVAAGNSGKNANSFSPANNLNVIAVSAITDSDGKCGAKGGSTNFGGDDRFAGFSNYGSTIDMAAPGVDILSTSMNGGYAKMSGTSAAAPHVAGAAGLYKAANPNATPSQVKSGLVANAVTSSVTTCDGNGFGYFSGDKDTSREPLLYLKGIGPTNGGSGGEGETPSNQPGGNGGPVVIANADGRLEVFVID